MRIGVDICKERAFFAYTQSNGEIKLIYWDNCTESLAVSDDLDSFFRTVHRNLEQMFQDESLELFLGTDARDVYKNKYFQSAQKAGFIVCGGSNRENLTVVAHASKIYDVTVVYVIYAEKMNTVVHRLVRKKAGATVTKDMFSCEEGKPEQFDTDQLMNHNGWRETLCTKINGEKNVAVILEGERREELARCLKNTPIVKSGYGRRNFSVAYGAAIVANNLNVPRTGVFTTRLSFVVKHGIQNEVTIFEAGEVLEQRKEYYKKIQFSTKFTSAEVLVYDDGVCIDRFYIRWDNVTEEQETIHCFNVCAVLVEDGIKLTLQELIEKRSLLGITSSKNKQTVAVRKIVFGGEQNET